MLTVDRMKGLVKVPLFWEKQASCKRCLKNELTLANFEFYRSLFDYCLLIRHHPRFFDQVGRQTTSAYIENKHFFTKSCHRQTYQNYEQPPQSLQNLYF